MFAMLGDVRFELLTGFTAFDETHTAAYAKHDVLAGRPRLQAMGNDLTSIRFSIKLHWKLGNPDAQYKGLIAAKEAQQALALVYGSGRGKRVFTALCRICWALPWAVRWRLWSTM